MLKRKAVVVAVLSALGPAQASADDAGHDAHTTRSSDVPPDAPRFDAYGASPYRGPNAEPHVTGHARLFRTRIREWSRVPPNFAGHFILATWGCGTDCVQIVVIDAVTGHVFEPAGLTTNVAVDVHEEPMQDDDPWPGSGSLRFRRDSRLLVVIGMPEEDPSRRGISYYVWRGTKFVLVRFVKKA